MKRIILPSISNREEEKETVNLTKNDPNELAWTDRQRIALAQEGLNEVEVQEKAEFYQDLHQESYANTTLLVSGQTWTKCKLALLY